MNLSFSTSRAFMFVFCLTCFSFVFVAQSQGQIIIEILDMQGLSGSSDSTDITIVQPNRELFPQTPSAPSNNQLLAAADDSAPIDLVIYDAQHRPVMRQRYLSPERIQLPTLPNGIYTLVFRREGKVFSKRIGIRH